MESYHIDLLDHLSQVYPQISYRVTFYSIWHLFKVAVKSSWWNPRSPGSIGTELLNIHRSVHDSIRRPVRHGGCAGHGSGAYTPDRGLC